MSESDKRPPPLDVSLDDIGEAVEDRRNGYGTSLVPESRRKRQHGEIDVDDGLDPGLQHRVVCAIADAHLSSEDSLGAEETLAAIRGAGVTSEAFLDMLDDPEFRDLFFTKNWQLFVFVEWPAILKAAVSAAKDGDTRAIDKLMKYQIDMNARLKEDREAIFAAGKTEHIIGHCRRLIAKLTRLMDALEFTKDRTPTDGQATAILDGMFGAVRKVGREDGE